MERRPTITGRKGVAREEEEMKLNRFYIGLASVVFAVAVLLTAYPSDAAEYESLVPLLIDLEEWQAEEPEGMDVDMGTTQMIQAQRIYSQGAKEIHAMVLIGNSAMTRMHGVQSMQAQTPEARVKVTEIDGFPVTLQHAKNENEGAVVVSLESSEQQGAVFIMHYAGMRQEEALAVAKQFDWEKFRQASRRWMR
jgi:hypothetical protein